MNKNIIRGSNKYALTLQLYNLESLAISMKMEYIKQIAIISLSEIHPKEKIIEIFLSAISIPWNFSLLAKWILKEYSFMEFQAEGSLKKKPLCNKYP